MKKKTKTWLIALGVFVVIGLIGSIGGRDKTPDVRVTQEETATAAPTASPKPAATPKPTNKPAATEKPLSTLEPVTTWTAPPDRSAPAEDPTPTPAPEAKELDYVLNTSTMRFHRPSCSSVKDIKDYNRQDVHATRDSVIAQGYQPCGKCKP